MKPHIRILAYEGYSAGFATTLTTRFEVSIESDNGSYDMHCGFCNGYGLGEVQANDIASKLSKVTQLPIRHAKSETKSESVISYV